MTGLEDVGGVAFPAAGMPRGVAQSNQTLARDFIDLTFALERGEPLRGLLRHEGPVRVYLRPGPLTAYRRDLENLLQRFRVEAGVDIASVASASEAQIHIDGVPIRELQRIDPGAACFIVPGETSWAGFRGKSPRARLRWSEQRTLGTIGIFIPSDTFPQDIRDCLHEEIAQALGPANDLYRLPNTVFNDDNFHSIVTNFDMLMLRALYDPSLRSGLPREVVAGRINGILDRINPRGVGRGALPTAPATPQWNQQIEQALTRRNPLSRRISAADRAVAIARNMRPVDHRIGVALITRGRLLRERDPAAAASDFVEAYQRLRGVLGADDVRTAQAALHMALVGLDVGDFAPAQRVAERAIPVARRGQNAVLLSSLMLVRAKALEAQGRLDEARSGQLDHLRWARYAFGDQDGRRARRLAALEADEAVLSN
ncbi:MAG: DUF2927 domain-containing protein [Pseudomonadota bacterium]